MNLDYAIGIIGGGPAGMSAAIYAARAGRSAAIFEGAACGGQMLLAHEIENYPGVTKAAGYALADQMMEQVRTLGVSTIYGAVTSVAKQDGAFTIQCGKKSYTVGAVIVASGTDRRTLGVPGESEFLGRGVSYCAVCDGRFFTGKDVAVVGGGNTALGDALYLANICKSVTLIHRRDAFRADRILVDRLAGVSNVQTVMNARVKSIEGDAKVQSLEIVSTAQSGVSSPMVLHTDAVFVAVGSVPKLDFLSIMDGLTFDDGGYITTDDRCRTDVPGLFAAGDVRSKMLRQIATAVSDGAIAGTEAVEYLDGLAE